MSENEVKIAFFGGEPLAVPILEELKVAGIQPALIVCNPDRPQGRKMLLTPPPVKSWALEHKIDVFQPESLAADADRHDSGVEEKLKDYDLFVVVAYSKIIPKHILDIPKHGVLNLHPSLLPKLRGSSPIRSAILEDERETGVTIIKLDEKMDHGPILAQMKMNIAPENWPLRGRELDEGLARMGGALLAATIPEWIAGTITPIEQNHDEATFTKKIEKADGELALDPHTLPSGDEAYQILLKIRAFDGWPGTFFMHDGKRIKIADTELTSNGQLNILRVIPEGKSETNFESWREYSL